MEVPDKKSLSEKELEDLVIVPALHRSGKQPRYYQLIAVNRTLEAVLRGQRRLLLVMVCMVAIGQAGQAD